MTDIVNLHMSKLHSLPLSVALWRLQPFVLRNLQEALLRSFWATEWWPRFTNDWVLMHFVSNTRLDWLKKTAWAAANSGPTTCGADVLPKCWLLLLGFKGSWPMLAISLEHLRWSSMAVRIWVAKYSYGYHFATPWVICWIQQNLCRISTVLFGIIRHFTLMASSGIETTDRLFTARIALDPVWAMLF